LTTIQVWTAKMLRQRGEHADQRVRIGGCGRQKAGAGAIRRLPIAAAVSA
jgi:hypothetical protein